MSDMAYEGQTFTITEEFLNDFDEVVVPGDASGAPHVRLLDTDKSVIAEVYATPNVTETGSWRADLPIPNMNLRDNVRLYAYWTLVDNEGTTYRAKTPIDVAPASEGRDSDLIIMCGKDTRMQLSLPFRYRPKVAAQPANLDKGKPAQPAKPGDELSFSLYYNNAEIFTLPGEDKSIKLERFKDRTVVDMPAVVGKAQMFPLVLIVNHKPRREIAATQYTYKLWAITPQIAVAARQLEDYINKAKLANVIPELEYTQSDLLEYLSRGLNLFNMIPTIVTAFTGTNMQGPIMNAWLTCSAYYALGAQLQAEGALAFDFGGQTVSLNVDRTPSIESALGRIENELENYVKPFKKLLERAGVTGGDGSQGGKFIDGSGKLGVLTLSNTAMTRLPATGRGASNGFRNFF